MAEILGYQEKLLSEKRAYLWKITINIKINRKTKDSFTISFQPILFQGIKGMISKFK
jgi:hypothetical protein